MLLLLHADGGEELDLNSLERLIKKIMEYCNLFGMSQKPLKNNPTDLISENDADINRFFDFNDVEGIDIDDEDARYRKVLKFKDCNVFEIPVNTNHIEDFVYLGGDDKSIINTLKKSASDVGDDPNNYYLSLFSKFLTKIPIALLSTILSPKMLLPMVLAYKMLVDNVDQDVKKFLLKIKNIIMKIMGQLFKIFILAFWSVIKMELLKFLVKVAFKFLANKLKRYKTIVLALIALLVKLLDTDLTDCTSLFSLIGATIDGALSTPAKIPIPGILLSLSDYLPGFSTDRAYMNTIQKMSDAGVETGTLHGEPNDLNTVVKSNIDGLFEEMDKNSFVKVSNKELILPFGVIPPGVLNASGKLF